MNTRSKKQAKRTAVDESAKQPTIKSLGELNFTVYRLDGVIVMLHVDRPVELGSGRPYCIAYRPYGDAKQFSLGQDEELDELIVAVDEPGIVRRVVSLMRRVPS